MESNLRHPDLKYHMLPFCHKLLPGGYAKYQGQDMETQKQHIEINGLI